jgi:hypothetical protein
VLGLDQGGTFLLKPVRRFQLSAFSFQLQRDCVFFLVCFVARHQIEGRRGKEVMEHGSDVHLPQPQNKSSYLLYFALFCFIFIVSSICFDRVFGRFVTREVKKKTSGLITKTWPFFLRVSPPPLVVLLNFLIAFFGRFVTRAAATGYLLTSLFFSRRHLASF